MDRIDQIRERTQHHAPNQSDYVLVYRVDYEWMLYEITRLQGVGRVQHKEVSRLQDVIRVQNQDLADLRAYRDNASKQLDRSMEDWVLGSCFKPCEDQPDCVVCRKQYIKKGNDKLHPGNGVR